VTRRRRGQLAREITRNLLSAFCKTTGFCSAVRALDEKSRASCGVFGSPRLRRHPWGTGANARGGTGPHFYGDVLPRRIFLVGLAELRELGRLPRAVLRSPSGFFRPNGLSDGSTVMPATRKTRMQMYITLANLFRVIRRASSRPATRAILSTASLHSYPDRSSNERHFFLSLCCLSPCPTANAVTLSPHFLRNSGSSLVSRFNHAGA